MSYGGKAARPTASPRVSALRSSHGAPTNGDTSRSPARRRGSPYEESRDWRALGLFAAGLAVGAAMGAGAALLFAPQSGEEVRASIGRGGRRLGTRAHDAWDDLRDELRWAARRSVKRLRRGATRGRWKLEDRFQGRHPSDDEANDS
jgi:YtxH-like protein